MSWWWPFSRRGNGLSGEAQPLVGTINSSDTRVVNMPSSAASSHSALTRYSPTSLADFIASIPVPDSWVKKSDFVNQLTSILFVLVLWSAFTYGGKDAGLGLIPEFAMCVLWNIPGAVRGTLALPGQFKKAKESALNTNEKFISAWVNLIFYPFVYPALTLRAFGTAAMEAKQIGGVECLWKSDELLGKPNAWIGSDSVFLIGSSGDARDNLVSRRRASQKSDPIVLLTHRFQRYEAAKNNPHISEEKKNRIAFELRALLTACHNHSELKNNVTFIEINNKIPLSTLPTMSEQTACSVSNFLINIQEHKARTHRLAALGDVTMTMGALFGLLSMAVESWAKQFLIPSIICFAPSFLEKYNQEVFAPYFFGETKIPNPEAIIREQLGLPAGSIGDFISANKLEMVKDHSSLLISDIAFFSAPQIQALEPVAAIRIEIPAAVDTLLETAAPATSRHTSILSASVTVAPPQRAPSPLSAQGEHSSGFFVRTNTEEETIAGIITAAQSINNSPQTNLSSPNDRIPVLKLP